MKKLRRLMCILISAVMFLGSLNVNVTAAAEENISAAEEPVLENIAPQATITSTKNSTAEHEKLVDESYGVGFTGLALIRDGYEYAADNPGLAEFAFDSDQDIHSIDVILELGKNGSDASNFTFTYNLKGQKFDETGWEMIAENQVQTRVTADYIRTHTVGKDYSKIRFELLKVENTANQPTWNAYGIAEFRIFSEVDDEPAAGGNIAPYATITSSANNATEQAKWINGIVSTTEADFGWLDAKADQTNESDPAFAEFAYSADMQIDRVEIAFPQVTATSDSFKYYYNLLAQKSGQTDWTTIVSGEVATRLANGYLKTHEVNGQYSKIKLEITKVENTIGGYYWAGIQEFRIFGSEIAKPKASITKDSAITSTYNNETEHAKWHDDKAGIGAPVGLIKNSAQTDISNPAFAQFSYDSAMQIDGLEIVFEETGSSDDSEFKFTYNLFGKKPGAGETEWTTIAADQTATRITGQNVKTHEVDEVFTAIRLEVPKVDNKASNVYRYPAMTEFRIFGEKYIDYGDSASWIDIAYESTITSTYNQQAQHEKWIDGVKTGVGDLYVGLIKNSPQNTPNSPAFAQFTFDEERAVASVEAHFEEFGTADANNFKFYYEVLGQKAEQLDWTTIAANQTATRVAGEAVGIFQVRESYKAIRINVLNVETKNGAGYPALTEFRILSPMDVGGGGGPDDPTNIAQKKPVHAHSGHSTSSNAVDGSTRTIWMGAEYPAYIDIDLEKNYDISQIEVFTQPTAITQYAIYTSMDGVDYDFLTEKADNEKGSEEGEIHQAGGRKARIVRVYVEYYSASAAAVINEIKVRGTESSDQTIQTAPAIDIEAYEDSAYDDAVTDQDAIEEVEGIVERNFGAQYVDWFDFAIEAPDSNGYDFYELSDSGGKIRITGNSGVSLATGLNYYLKYYCNVHISQSGNQTNMPDDIVPVGDTVRKETAFPIRYSYNYCTFSYTMAFWGEEEWRKELDWLALSGVNLVLDITAQEEVWRRFLTKIGYEHQDIKDFIVGPAFYGWAYMSNMYSFGGPIHDSWFADRTELARKNQLIMRKLGMTPVLQGYSGMVPVDIANYDDSIPAGEPGKPTVIGQGSWCGTARPSMLRTDSETFLKYAELFYAAQAEVYGDITDYYATDPFHEGGIKDGLNEAYISETVMEEMLDFDEDAIWVIQAWTANPTRESLEGLKDYRDHTLILDLHAEKNSRSEWDDTSHGGKEFMNSPWVYCMLNNFGGRTGLRGSTENWVPELAQIKKKAPYVTGIGIIPEGSHNNPFLYDLFFEVIWSETPDDMEVTDMDEWIKNYTTRRYGAESESAAEAWNIINAVAYKEDASGTDQSSESIFNARPSADVTRVSPWGSTAINIDTVAFKKALDLLLKDYNTLKASDAYLYDVADVMEQSLTHETVGLYNAMKNAYNNKNLAAFDAAAEEFLAMGEKVEKVLSTREEFLLGTWLGGAKKISEDTDDFTKKLFDINARALITTWGAKNLNGLNDYATKQWAGLTKDYFLGRWKVWIDQAHDYISSGGTAPTTGAGWYPSDWQWVLGHTGEGDDGNGNYTDEATPTDLFALAYEDADTSVTLTQSGGNVAANYIIRNDSGDDIDLLCIVATYDADGKLVNEESEELSIDDGGINTTNINLPFDAATAQAFVWDADTLVPFLDSISLVKNLAAGGTADASSIEHTNFPAQEAFDGIRADDASRWSSKDLNDSNPQWLSVDLGSSQPIKEIDIYWRKQSAGMNYIIQTSDDGTDWNDVEEVSMTEDELEAALEDTPIRHVLEDGITAQHIRVYITKGLFADTRYPYISILEIEVYGTELSVD